MSPQIILNQGLTWQTLPSATVHRAIDAAELRARLDIMRVEWESARDIHPGTVDAVLSVIDEIRDMTSGEVETW